MDYIINKRYADHRHGTGVQLKLLANQLAEKPWHICWDDARNVPDSYAPVCNLNTSLLRAWPFRRGRGFVGRVESALGRTWHRQARITKRLRSISEPLLRGPRHALQRSLRTFLPLPFRRGEGRGEGSFHVAHPMVPSVASESRAYVIIASEDEAQITRQILDVLRPAYVVNVMDYLHLGATALSDFPHFAAVLRQAKSVFALTPPIQKALSRICGRKDISLLSVAREPAPAVVRPFIPGTRPLEIVMMGSVDYTRGLQELHRFCFGLETLGVNFCLNYIGTQEMRKRLGPNLPVKYQGVRLGAEREALLNSMHLAYLPGPDGDPARDYLARFSFPSRLTDYFWHGLPVLGPLFNSTATAQMLGGLSGNGVWFSPDSRQLVGVVKALLERPRSWEAASQAVYNFAQQHFSIEKSANAIRRAFDN